MPHTGDTGRAAEEIPVSGTNIPAGVETAGDAALTTSGSMPSAADVLDAVLRRAGDDVLMWLASTISTDACGRSVAEATIGALGETVDGNSYGTGPHGAIRGNTGPVLGRHPHTVASLNGWKHRPGAVS